MSKSVIIAVGGTGQLVLHYYTQLFQVGAIRDSFDGVVLDSDALMPSLAKLQLFWNAVRVAHPSDSVPRLEYIPVSQGFAGRIENALAGQPLPNAPELHPVEAFVDSESLKQQVNEGLFARPALSAVMKTDWKRLPLPTFAGVQRVIVIGSLIGGTGGGLMAPLLNELATRLRAVGMDRPRLRAVLFGEYFRVEGSNQLVRDARERYPSNKLFVAHTLRELAPPELEHFIFVEPENPVERETAKERDAMNMQFPEETHPIWQGVSAVEEVRTNTTWPNAASFEDKERGISARRDYNSDMTKIRDRIGVATALHMRLVLTSFLREVWFDRFYGRELPTMVASGFASAGRNPALGITSIRKFCGNLQKEYVRTWGELKGVFPLSTSTANLPAIRQTNWSAIRTDVPELTQSEEGLLHTVAANILYSALRGGNS
jgi:hypothetical protein